MDSDKKRCVFVSVILMRLSGAFLLNCELFALTLLFALPLGWWSRLAP